MNSLERVVAAITHKNPDRVPVIAVSITRSLQEAGYTLQDAINDGKKIAQGKIAAHEEFQDDGIVAALDLFVEPEALGARTELREHVPIVVEWPLAKDKGAIDRLEIPDPHKDGRMPVILEELKVLWPRYKDTVAIGPVTSGPITCASNLRGVENLLLDMVLDPKYVHQLLRICTDTIKEYWKAIFEVGTHAVIMLDPICTNTLMSPEQYEEFSMPYVRELFSLANEKGVVPVNHICADSSMIWEQMVEVGAPAIQIDYPINLADAKRRVGDKACIMGNVNPIEVILYGTPEEIYQVAKACIQAAGNNSGFVLTAGCDLNPRTSRENIKAMIKAAKDTYYTEDMKVAFAA